MKTVKRIALREFHYALDGRNVRRFDAGEEVELAADHLQRFLDDGSLVPGPKDTPAPAGEESGEGDAAESPTRRRRGRAS